MNVRIATSNDYLNVEKLWLELNKYHAGLEPNIIKKVDVYQTEKDFLEVLTDPKQDILVIEVKDAILAAAWIMQREHTGGQAIPTPVAFIQEICVSKNIRRQGLGKTLMIEINMWAKKRGLKEIEFNVWSQNKIALAFYQEMGFRYTRHEMTRPVV